MSNIVAIVGRPNVGKSTLFNRLTDDSKSITYNTSGTTRDRNYGYGEWCGVNFTVIDTGGYLEDDRDEFANDIKKQILSALSHANVLLFMVDCKSGLVAGDAEFANILRELKKPVILVANKADTTQMSWLSSEFYSLGFGEPYAISSSNGSGTGELMDYLITFLDKNKLIEEEELPKVAILGRPNVGKSSFINAILGEERCVVSSVAGTTRDSIDSLYELYGHKLIITDTAGIRKKNKEKEDIEFYSVMRSISAMQRSDVCIIMIDATRGVEGQDINLISLACRYKKAIMLLINKWDLIEKDHKTMKEFRSVIESRVQIMKDIPMIFTSAINKQRIFDAIKLANELYQRLKTRIATSKLNEILLPIIENYPPPAIKGKYVKIKYITQLPSKNIIFAFFCNLPQYVSPNYKSYLENRIRENFNLAGIPFSIVFRRK